LDEASEQTISMALGGVGKIVRTSVEDRTLEDEHGLKLTDNDGRKNGDEEDTENAKLQVTDTVAELQLGERDEQRDEGGDEQTREDVSGVAPQRHVLALHDSLHLEQERSSIYEGKC